MSSSNLHRIITRRRYAGGHEGAKAAPDDHGEKYVKVVKTRSEVSGSGKTVGKGKGRVKSSAAASAAKGGDKPTVLKVTVAKVTPKLIPLPFFEDTPAEGTH